MTNLEITAEAEIRLNEFEERTGYPARSSLKELELAGGRYFSSRDGKVEYVFMDPTGVEQEVYCWKRQNKDGDFIIHLETRVTNKF